ncbi:MAG: hypothetical protein KBS63_00530, partial [Clostridiales bacterium]|nr:hypothetical protein [Candidatus Crickella caballi]
KLELETRKPLKLQKIIPKQDCASRRRGDSRLLWEREIGIIDYKIKGSSDSCSKSEGKEVGCERVEEKSEGKEAGCEQHVEVERNRKRAKSERTKSY